MSMDNNVQTAKRQKTYDESDIDSDDDAPRAVIAGRGHPETSTVNAMFTMVRDIKQQLGDMAHTFQTLQERQAEDRYQQVILAAEIREIRKEQYRQAENRDVLETCKNLMAAVTSTFGLRSTLVCRESQKSDETREPAQQPTDDQPTHLPPQPPTHQPSAKLTCIGGKVIIPVQHHDVNPGAIYEPVEIAAEEYDSLRRKSAKATSFVRGLLPYFFDALVMRKSNFDGTTVLTKDGQVKKDRLDRRLVLSMLDQVELEFPGRVKGKHFVQIRSVINDKCRHS